ncbi:acylglycerol kinase, mitochondrial-like [Pomacea canaliculata]|uniref:acylglycerol kinase, mitochondrial-like n=1 Tax=Pomacea canaliculata TaxID=400727 RepID=UPI000D731152|nr:acylglycerol kinase, mitochondrial-like [Pomacea canaliculata]
MALVVRIGKTLRTHWKKSIFGFCAVTYGIKYAHDRYEEILLRRLYCDEAKKYGDEKITLSERPRRVTVFLNPAAHGGKATKLFEKNAAPILYLAGIEVNVVKTEYDGQVKKFLGVLERDDTDAIVVAGGDGAVLETVTGIMRKEDKNFYGIPMGVIPLGYTNTFARIFYGPDKETVRIIADAAMAVVKEVTKKVDVLKIDGGEGKTTFALCGMEIGAYRDAEERKKKYWYFGPLKSRWTYLWTAVKNWPPAFKVDISYVEATEDNMRLPEPAVPSSSKNWNFFNFLFRRNQQTTIEEVLKEPEEESEEEKKIMRSTSTVELTLLVSKHAVRTDCSWH